MIETTRKRRNDDVTESCDRALKSAKLHAHADRPGAGGDLLSLLDFTALESHSDISGRFDQLAIALLHDYFLCVSAPSASNKSDTSMPQEFEFEILELEFYLRKEGCHEDPFAHASEEQRVAGKWYFHRAPRRSADSSRSATSLTGYRGGTRKGLDLTLGGRVIVTSPYFEKAGANSSSRTSASAEAGSEVRGGALLRSIRSVPCTGSEAKVVSGPSLLVDEILRLCEASSIKELVQTTWADDTSALSARSSTRAALYLKRRPQPAVGASLRSGAPESNPVVYSSPRIGLDLSHPGTTPDREHPRVVFVAKPYRYFVRPELLIKNGRAQTLLGVRAALLASGLINDDDSEESCAEVVKVMGIKAPAVKKLLEEYEGGKKAGRLESFVGAKGKGVGASPGTYLRMMGLLSRE